MSTIAKARTARTQDTVHPELVGLGRQESRYAPIVWAVTRISLGSIFLWAFLDKTFGLGFATPAERSWLSGGSPTAGFLGGVEGPMAGLFTPIAGQAWADWLFMAGLLGIGLALVLGIGMRIATVSGVVMLFLMWLAVLPIVNHPFLDDHLVYALVLVGLLASNAGRTLGLGRTWESLPVVQRFPILK